jgi:hypothetical protein
MDQYFEFIIIAMNKLKALNSQAKFLEKSPKKAEFRPCMKMDPN